MIAVVIDFTIYPFDSAFPSWIAWQLNASRILHSKGGLMSWGVLVVRRPLSAGKETLIVVETFRDAIELLLGKAMVERMHVGAMEEMQSEITSRLSEFESVALLDIGSTFDVWNSRDRVPINFLALCGRHFVREGG
jgi:hypothetical protein